MTREEASKWLQGIEERYFHGGDEVYDKRRREAVRMAIEALEEAKKHEKTWEWCTDCKEYDHENHCCHRMNNVIYDTLCGTIVVVGEWIPHETQVTWGDGTTDVTMFRCSACGYEQDWQSKFCPNCGSYNHER